MTEETKLNCSVNHNYREGYQQGRADFAEWICTKYLDKNTNILCIEELGGADDLLEEYIKSVK